MCAVANWRIGGERERGREGEKGRIGEEEEEERRKRGKEKRRGCTGSLNSAPFLRPVCGAEAGAWGGRAGDGAPRPVLSTPGLRADEPGCQRPQQAPETVTASIRQLSLAPGCDVLVIHTHTHAGVCIYRMCVCVCLFVRKEEAVFV